MDRYDLSSVVTVLEKYQYTRVVLQFPDEELDNCVDVYDYIVSHLTGNNRAVDVYVTADSTWGSSIDDVSAMHCNGEVLVYFGSDLSSSGSIPVMIVPPLLSVDAEDCSQKIIATVKGIGNSGSLKKSLLLMYEPGCFRSCDAIVRMLQEHNQQHLISQDTTNDTPHNLIVDEIKVARLPLQADLGNWRPQVSTKLNQRRELAQGESAVADAEASEDAPPAGGLPDDIRRTGTSSSPSECICVGGLLIPCASLYDAQRSTKDDCVVVYIGDKEEQMVNILLRLSEHTVLHYSLASGGAMKTLRGTETIEFRERYGGVMRVKDAEIVGIIVGSMGLTGELTKDILRRLQTLILAARKRYYCFVMGRLNEAKLCNFPEIDIFCLVSNEDNANIKPKTFHKPVVTPFELELGLGAREWSSSFDTDLTSLLGNGVEDLQLAVENVKTANPFEGDSDEEDETRGEYFFDLDNLDNIQAYSFETVAAEEPLKLSNEGTTGAGNGPCTTTSSSSSSSSSSTNPNTALVAVPSSSSPPVVAVPAPDARQQLTVFHSAAAGYLQDREYQGLDPKVDMQQAEMRLVPGQYGVAAAYRTQQLPSEQQQQQQQPQPTSTEADTHTRTSSSSSSSSLPCDSSISSSLPER